MKKRFVYDMVSTTVSCTRILHLQSRGIRDCQDSWKFGPCIGCDPRAVLNVTASLVPLNRVGGDASHSVILLLEYSVLVVTLHIVLLRCVCLVTTCVGGDLHSNTTTVCVGGDVPAYYYYYVCLCLW